MIYLYPSDDTLEADLRAVLKTWLEVPIGGAEFTFRVTKAIEQRITDFYDRGGHMFYSPSGKVERSDIVVEVTPVGPTLNIYFRKREDAL